MKTKCVHNTTIEVVQKGWVWPRLIAHRFIGGEYLVEVGYQRTSVFYTCLLPFLFGFAPLERRGIVRVHCVALFVGRFSRPPVRRLQVASRWDRGQQREGKITKSRQRPSGAAGSQQGPASARADGQMGSAGETPRERRCIHTHPIPYDIAQKLKLQTYRINYICNVHTFPSLNDLTSFLPLSSQCLTSLRRVASPIRQ